MSKSSANSYCDTLYARDVPAERIEAARSLVVAIDREPFSVWCVRGTIFVEYQNDDLFLCFGFHPYGGYLTGHVGDQIIDERPEVADFCARYEHYVGSAA